MKPRLLRFNEINKEIPLWDFHIHTTITDGTSSIEEFIQTGINRGLQEIAFTEHVRKTSEWYPEFIEKIEALREVYKHKIIIFHGIEAKVLNSDGDLDASDEMLDTAELVLGSVHRFPGFDNVPTVSNYHLAEEEFAKTEFGLAKAILKNPDVDVLAHPGGMFIRKFRKNVPTGVMEELIELVNRYDKAIEINSSYLKDISLNAEPFLRMNPLISLGSDAHNKDELGNIIQFMKKIIETGYHD
ncbi:MAG: PHP domain-containing protein [Methanoregula sp.]